MRWPRNTAAASIAESCRESWTKSAELTEIGYPGPGRASSPVVCYTRRVMGRLRAYFAAEGSPLDLALFRVLLFAVLALNHSLPHLLAQAEEPRSLLVPMFGWG